MLIINGLSKNFGKKLVLDGVNLAFDKKVYGLLGPNGAGKTTLLRCVTSLYRVKKNTVTIDGRDISGGGVNIGYLPQRFGLFRDLTAAEALVMLASVKGIDKKTASDEARRVLDLVNLSDKADVRVRKLSGGMVRRLGIAQAFVGDPEILIFDEPTAGLDPEERIRFGNLITDCSEGKTVIISTHIVTDVESVCSHAAIINGGRVIAEAPVSDIREKARGRVYEIPKKEAEGFTVLNSSERGSAQICRVLSDRPLPYEPQEPTLEDGYMALLKNV